jgi:hypothetical protein
MDTRKDVSKNEATNRLFDVALGAKDALRAKYYCLEALRIALGAIGVQRGSSLEEIDSLYLSRTGARDCRGDGHRDDCACSGCDDDAGAFDARTYHGN